MNSSQFRPTGFKFLPPVVKNLVIINVLFFLATFGLGAAKGWDLTEILGMHYFASDAFRPYQIVTYMFMHASFWHIFFNMFALWMFGYALENIWGPKRFLIYYLVTGLGAAAVHFLIVYVQFYPTMSSISQFIVSPTADNLNLFISSPHFEYATQAFRDYIMANRDLLAAGKVSSYDVSELILRVDQFRGELLNSQPGVVGASGAVFGILLAFGMLFPNTTIYIYFAIPVKAKYFVIIYGALELIMGISNRAGDNVAHFAHLGGMLFGLVLILIWKRQQKNKRFFTKDDF